MKLTGPRKLHTTQYGYYCTSETPTGGSIGIAKNLSIMTAISTSTKSDKFLEWLDKKGKVYQAENITLEERVAFVPVYINRGLLGYTDSPYELTSVIKLFKRIKTGSTINCAYKFTSINSSQNLQYLFFWQHYQNKKIE